MFILQFSATPPARQTSAQPVCAIAVRITSVVTISSCFWPLAAMSVKRWSSGWPRSAAGTEHILELLGEDPLLPGREIAGKDFGVAAALVERVIELIVDAVRAQQIGELVQIFRTAIGGQTHDLVLVIGHLVAEILRQHAVIQAEAVVPAESRQHLEVVALDMGDHSGTGVAGKIETGDGGLRKSRAVIAARGVAEVVIVELDLRAVAELVLEIFGQPPLVIGVGPQRRADEVDIAHGDAGLLQAKADGAARQFAARVLGQRKALFFGSRNQLPVAKQHRGPVMVAVLDAGTDSNHIHALLCLPPGTSRWGKG